jgi:hypothetical protein
LSSPAAGERWRGGSTSCYAPAMRSLSGSSSRAGRRAGGSTHAACWTRRSSSCPSRRPPGPVRRWSRRRRSEECPADRAPTTGLRGATDVVVRPTGGTTDRLALVLVVAVVALLGGLAAGVVVRGRFRRLAPAVPPQPQRELVGPSSATILGVALWSGAILTEAWLEATGRLAMVAAGVLGPVALFAWPGVLVAWRAARHTLGAEELSGSDARTIAVRGRFPQIDRSRQGFVPVTGPGPEGTVMPRLAVVSPSPRRPHDRCRTPSTGRDPFLRPEGDR